MFGHVEEGPEHEEFPVKINKYLAVFQCLVTLLWIASVLPAQKFIIAIGDIIYNIQDESDTLDNDHNIDIVKILFVDMKDTKRCILRQIEILLPIELVVAKYCFELTQASKHRIEMGN